MEHFYSFSFFLSLKWDSVFIKEEIKVSLLGQVWSSSNIYVANTACIGGDHWALQFGSWFLVSVFSSCFLFRSSSKHLLYFSFYIIKNEEIILLSLSPIHLCRWNPLMVARSWHRNWLEEILSTQPEGRIRILPSPYISLPLMSIVRIARWAVFSLLSILPDSS